MIDFIIGPLLMGFVGALLFASDECFGDGERDFKGFIYAWLLGAAVMTPFSLFFGWLYP